MYILSFLKNKKHIISKRNFLDDYSNISSKKIDMTMSGKYLGKYPELDIDLNDLDKYPLKYYIDELKQTIRKKYNIKNEIIIGNGSNGILMNLVKIYLKKGDNLVTPYYTFNQLEYAATSLNAKTKRVFMDEDNINFDNIIKNIDKKTKLIYICNPNNPTGKYIDVKKLIELSKRVKNIKIIIDESTIEFSNKKSILDYSLPKNIIVVRTFSKAFGIANLRVGYMICNKDVYKKYKENVTNNEVSSINCKIAIKLLKSNLYKENVKLVLNERNYLKKELNKIGIETYDSDSNILLTKTCFSKKELDLLEKTEISIVPVKDIKNNIHIRIAVQDSKTNKEFINAIKKLNKRM